MVGVPVRCLSKMQEGSHGNMGGTVGDQDVRFAHDQARERHEHVRNLADF